MTKIVARLHGGSSYAWGENAEVFSSLSEALDVYNTCEKWGFDPRTKLGTPTWGADYEGQVVGHAWKMRVEDEETSSEDRNSGVRTVPLPDAEADYELVRLPRGGYKWRKIS